MIDKEFTISELPDYKFRVAKINGVEILALRTQIDFNDISKTQTTFKFILEHLEIYLGGQWQKVKIANREIYLPEGIEDNPIALNELISYFLNNVIKPLFQKSNG